MKVSAKRDKDFVTEVDKGSRGGHHRGAWRSVSGARDSSRRVRASGDSEYVWIIDPLDGTTNFIHGVPQYAISIALAHKGVLTHAVVYDPTKNELFTAVKGGGAYLNERRIRVSSASS
ncbi:MAG: hypothetical protein M5R42_21085 [Rhodocyclaceae bacterium]|nr:hypothetical protein [Rhodocyclaceae bacterium]